MFSRNWHRSTIAYARFRESGTIDIFHGDEDVGRAFPDGRHIRFPHFIDVIMRLGLGPSGSARVSHVFCVNLIANG
jgi:hypothetical protein